MNLPKFGEKLSPQHIQLLESFSKNCRKSIIQMVTNAQSGHPGGSLSTLDYLATLYAFIISQTGEKVVVSHGHISPAVYSVLAELNYINKEEVIENFRKFGSKFEGHITRHVAGIDYGTGPLGVGVSVASAFAMAAKMKNNNQKAYALMGDGECQEGQVHEMIQFSKHHKLNNLILFVDYNKVQLTASLEETMDINIPETFKAGGFEVIEIDGHNYNEIWEALSKAQNSDKPVAIIGHTIMGKGVDFMEDTGKKNQSNWHGKAPSHEMIAKNLEELALTNEELEQVAELQNSVKYKPEVHKDPKLLEELDVNLGSAIRYPADKSIDCRSAYGNALADLAKNNKNIIALTADLKGSVKTDGVSENHPEQYIECGIAEQHMISAAGGFSLEATYHLLNIWCFHWWTGQAESNINNCNVKMVATHYGLSVGEDGPTHQAIDDKGSFLGMYNTMILEPACPNQTDAIIRFVAGHYGNFYVRMGRHKFPIITKENGEIYYDENYVYQYGKCDLIRKGQDLTIAASGACLHEALEAKKQIESANPNVSIEVIAVSSMKKFDRTLFDSIQKTGKLITVEDHNPLSGLGSQIALQLMKKGIALEAFQMLGTYNYQLSGTASQLYNAGKIDSEAIIEKAKNLL